MGDVRQRELVGVGGGCDGGGERTGSGEQINDERSNEWGHCGGNVFYGFL